MFAVHIRDFGLFLGLGLDVEYYTLYFSKESVESALETAILLVQHANSWASHQLLKMPCSLIVGLTGLPTLSMLLLRFVFINPFEFKVTPCMSFALLLLPPR